MSFFLLIRIHFYSNFAFMNIKLISKTFGLVFILLFFASCTDSKEKIRRELNNGIRANYATKFDVAKAHFEKVISWDKNNKEAYLNLGRVYFNMKEYSKSMESYNKAIIIDSTYGEAYRSRAQLNFYLGKKDLSCKDYLAAEKYGIKNLYNYTKFCK